ncbi:MAG TPA: formate/nitrite transporter family protein [Euzebyales bacterium]|nr:formate/nitrite transporter family protein [Euzebyales bacterium]
MSEAEQSSEHGEAAPRAAGTRVADAERATGSDTSRRERDPELESTFQAAVQEGTLRVRRSVPTLLATGLVGGVDVSIGVVALIIVEHETGNRLLGALAFTIGFIALTLARSELFTENFLVPVAAVIARQARLREVLRLWVGTCLMNLLGGWLVTGLLAAGKPEIAATTDTITAPLIEQGIGLPSFALAVIGGVVITVMTWMERNCDTQGPQVVAAVAAGFVLGAVPLNHVIVNSLEMFAALHTGAAFGYADYLRLALWWTFGNMIGGMVLVTLVRLVQVGRGPIEQARRAPFQRLHPGHPDQLIEE